MTRIAALAVLAALAMAGACATDPARVEAPRLISPARLESANVVPTSSERQIRYYVDAEGVLWDDRGRKLGPASSASPPAKP